MNDWWKLGLAGVAGAGLLAATGGAALPGLLSGGAGTGAGAGAGAGAVGAGVGTAGTAAAGTAGTAAATGAAGTAATTGSVLGGETLTGSVLFPEGVGAIGAEAGAAASPGVMAFTTPSVTGGAPLSGSLAGTSLEYGAPGAIADAGAAAAAAPPPSLFAKAGGFAKSGMKAASAYGTVNRAMGGGQAPAQAPMGQPMFQGQAAPIAPQGSGAPAQNNNAVLAAIARRRQRGF